jgi:hypothetical protein
VQFVEGTSHTNLLYKLLGPVASGPIALIVWTEVSEPIDLKIPFPGIHKALIGHHSSEEMEAIHLETFWFVKENPGSPKRPEATSLDHFSPHFASCCFTYRGQSMMGCKMGRILTN